MVTCPQHRVCYTVVNVTLNVSSVILVSFAKDLLLLQPSALLWCQATRIHWDAITIDPVNGLLHPQWHVGNCLNRTDNTPNIRWERVTAPDSGALIAMQKSTMATAHIRWQVYEYTSLPIYLSSNYVQGRNYDDVSKLQTRIQKENATASHMHWKLIWLTNNFPSVCCCYLMVSAFRQRPTHWQPLLPQSQCFFLIAIWNYCYLLTPHTFLSVNWKLAQSDLIFGKCDNRATIIDWTRFSFQISSTDQSQKKKIRKKKQKKNSVNKRPHRIQSRYYCYETFFPSFFQYFDFICCVRIEHDWLCCSRPSKTFLFDCTVFFMSKHNFFD